MQVKLLRVLEEKCIVRLGGEAPIETDVRILAATHRDLRAALAEGRFREDLFFRLNVVEIEVPPLRERREDVPLLVAHFLERAARPGKGARAPAMSAGAMKLLSGAPWPGNVRELRNAIEHAVALARGGTILPEHLPPHLAEGAAAPGATPGAAADSPLAAAVRRALRARLAERAAADTGAGAGAGAPGLHAALLAEIERPMIEEVLRFVGGNQVKASRLLGIHRTTLRKKIEEYGLGAGGQGSGGP